MRCPSVPLATLSLTAICVAACASGTLRDVDVNPNANRDGGTAFFASDEAGTHSLCERDLSVGALSISEQTCWVNQHVEDQATKLQFPCAGGAAVAKFGSHEFTGTVYGDQISISDFEPFEFKGCDWESTEIISGDFGTGALTYRYSERPLVSCPEPPCTANGKLKVSAGEVTVIK